MISQHAGKRITPEQRARWATLMTRSADEAGLPADPEFRGAFVAYIEWGSRIAVENSAVGATPPPKMPVPKWWWVCNATPGSRPSSTSAAASQDATDWKAPANGEPLAFDAHVNPLFRAMDRNSMLFASDLWSADDVLKHGEAILQRLKAGTMPCDGAWPDERIAVFEAWVRAQRHLQPSSS